MLSRSSRLLAVAGVLVALVSGCRSDEAALVEPGTPRIEADPGELRVLTYRDDPTAGQEWTDVLPAHEDVVVETTSFREDDSRDADADEPADVRRLFEAIGPGRTVLVELDLGSDVLHVWDFVVGDDTTLALHRAAARPEETTAVEVGRHVVVVRAEAGSLAPVLDAEGLALVASHVPAEGSDLRVDVFRGTSPGRFSIGYGEDVYPIEVRA